MDDTTQQNQQSTGALQDGQSPSDTTQDPGPTECEMPDAQAVQERVESGAERQSAESAESAFGGQAEGETPAESQ